MGVKAERLPTSLASPTAPPPHENKMDYQLPNQMKHRLLHLLASSARETSWVGLVSFAEVSIIRPLACRFCFNAELPSPSFSSVSGLKDDHPLCHPLHTQDVN